MFCVVVLKSAFFLTLCAFGSYFRTRPVSFLLGFVCLLVVVVVVLLVCLFVCLFVCLSSCLSGCQILGLFKWWSNVLYVRTNTFLERQQILAQITQGQDTTHQLANKSQTRCYDTRYFQLEEDVNKWSWMRWEARNQFQTVGEACKATFWPLQGFKARTLR